MEQWFTTLDTNEAAAFALLQATIRLQGTIEERTGNVTVRFFISTVSEDKRFHLPRIRKDYRRGLIQKNKPGHPLCTAFRSFINRDALIAIAKDGARFRLVPVPGAPGVHQMVSSDTGLPGITAGNAAVVKTADLKISAALLTAGFPLLRLDGPPGSHTYTHAAFPSPSSTDNTAFTSAADLIQSWRTDASAMPFDLPFTQAATALLFHQQIRAEVKNIIHTVLLSKPRTKMHAALRQDAAPAAWDQVTRFFTGST